MKALGAISISVVVLLTMAGLADGGDPPVIPTQNLKKSVQFWPPGKTITVCIDNPGLPPDPPFDFNAVYTQTVKAQFQTWQDYQTKNWDGAGYKFTFIDDCTKADIHVTWVNQFPPDPHTMIRPLGVTTATGTQGNTVMDAGGRDTGVISYSGTQVQIAVSRQSSPGDFRSSDEIGYIVEHEIGHAEGLVHTGSGLMSPNEPSGYVSPVSLDGDAGILAEKSSVLGQKSPPPGPPVQPRFLPNMIVPFVNFSPRDPQSTDYTYHIQSNPAGNSTFVQFGVSLGAAPTSVTPPAGWGYSFETHDPDTDFTINGAPYDDPTGIGYLHFTATDTSFGIGPGQTLSFLFTAPSGPSIPIPQQVYGITTDGTSQFLVVVPEPSSLVLATSAGLILIGYVAARRRSAPDWPSRAVGAR